ncbi:MAG: hypothetical protein K0V04_24115 [Deltaproteobacteria bacterium]|nr:hypothetical protein [Deltaproteobacteria bacterium]
MKSLLNYKAPMAVAAAACAGVFVSPGAASAGTIPGWNCVDMYQQNAGVLNYTLGGGVVNDDSIPRSFGCPLLRQDPDIDLIQVYVNAQSPLYEITCWAAELNRWGAGSWSPSDSTSLDDLGYDTLTFADGNLASGDASSQVVVRCDVPPAAESPWGDSSIRSIRWNES